MIKRKKSPVRSPRRKKDVSLAQDINLNISEIPLMIEKALSKPVSETVSPTGNGNKNTHNHSFKELLDVATGVWWTMGTLAFEATTPYRAGHFGYFIDLVGEQFICLECRDHFKTYIKAHPLQDEILDIKDQFLPEGCFRWYWKAQNAVNKFKKFGSHDQIPYHEAKDFFQKQSKGEGCTSCMVSPSQTNSSTSSYTNSNSNSYIENQPNTSQLNIQPQTKNELLNSGENMKRVKISYTSF